MTRTASACLPLLLALAAPNARADDAKPSRLSWWIEGRPWTCSDPLAPVARQVELACDAAGGRCRVAPEREGADRVAALTCGVRDAPWRLDAEDGAGRVLWSVTLAGDEETRARKAAMWIARAEGEGPPRESPSPTHESPKPADPTASPSPIPPPVVVVTHAGSRDKDDEGDHDRDDRSTITASVTSTLREEFGAGPMVGGRFSTAERAWGSLFLGIALDGITTPAQHQPDFYGHFGGIVAMGAPYSRGTLGLAFEGGAAARANPSTGNGPTFHGYVKGSAIVQVAGDSDVRPFVAFSYLRTSDAMDQMVVADFGLAWGAW